MKSSLALIITVALIFIILGAVAMVWYLNYTTSFTR
jgi:hypothetical protein